MLKGGNPLTVGVGIVIEVIRKNNSDYDPEVSADSIKAPTSRDPIYLGSLLGLFAKYIPDFVALMLSPKHTIGSVDGPVTVSRKELGAAFGGSIEPLGFDRFKTCELMAELLHCSNMGLLNEIGAEAFITARDAEREKLRLEGNLNPPTAHHDSDTDGLTIRSPNSSRLGSSSPEDFKRLEVQNGSDDDGFEQVTHFQGIEGDEKDEIKERDTKPDTSMSSDSKLAKFSTFLDKDDGQFVDEPLSSPRLGIESDMADVSLQVKPLSPTKKSADNVLAHRISTTLGDENVQSTNDPVHKVAAASESEKPTAGSENQTSTPTLTIPAASASEAEGLLPHPDDKPAPLFSGRQVDTPAGAKMAESTTLESQEVAAQVPIPDEAAGSVGDDSTFVENADISQINPTGSNPLISDVPVVGDYLKMQFVEHKVVPTILVSITLLIPSKEC